MAENLTGEYPRSVEELRSELPSLTEEEYDREVSQLKDYCLGLARENNAKGFVLEALKSAKHLDQIVSEMRHLKRDNLREGQIKALEKLKEINPNIKWYRGGTKIRWADFTSTESQKFFDADELETLIIDGGANGVLGIPGIAVNFLSRLATKEEPVLYSLPIDALIKGLQNNAIKLVTEHNYDLRVVVGDDRHEYIKFCREDLRVQKVIKK